MKRVCLLCSGALVCCHVLSCELRCLGRFEDAEGSEADQADLVGLSCYQAEAAMTPHANRQSCKRANTRHACLGLSEASGAPLPLSPTLAAAAAVDRPRGLSLSGSRRCPMPHTPCTVHRAPNTNPHAPCTTRQAPCARGRGAGGAAPEAG
jgi:hypothetical protein